MSPAQLMIQIVPNVVLQHALLVPQDISFLQLEHKSALLYHLVAKLELKLELVRHVSPDTMLLVVQYVQHVQMDVQHAN